VLLSLSQNVKGRSKRFFSSSKRPECLWGPLVLICDLYPDSFQGIKLSGREANHSHPYIAEARNEWSCTSTSLCAFKNAGSQHFTVYLVVSVPEIRDYLWRSK
jgi:hypothetical protein